MTHIRTSVTIREVFKFIKVFLPLPCFCLMVFLQSGCDGGICAASESVLEDADGDCVVDESDNCISISNPGATYNPEQFDGDEDGVGIPCDTNDADDTATLIKDVAFNAGGLYDFEGDCEDFAQTSLLQYENTVEIGDSSGTTYRGTALLNADGSRIAASFSNTSIVCTLDLDTLTQDAALSCQSVENQASCLSIGQRKTVQLWNDGVTPFGTDALDENPASL